MKEQETSGAAATARDDLKPKRQRRWLRTILGVAVSLGLLALVFRGADAREIVDALRRVSPVYVLAALLIDYASIPLRAVQWRWLLGNPHDVPLRESLRGICLGYLGNCLFPMRGGELLKAFVLSRSTPLAFGRILMSVVLTRLQDFLPVLAILFLTFTMVNLDEGIAIGGEGSGEAWVVSGDQLNRASHVFAAGVAAGAVALLAFYLWRGLIQRTITRVLPWAPERIRAKLGRQLTQALQAIEVVGAPRLFWGAQAVSAICWGLFVCTQIPLLLAFGIEPRAAVFTAIVTMGLTTIAQMLPSLPGAVGTYHATCVVALLLCNPAMDRNAALAYAVLSHLIGSFGPALTGFVFLPGSWQYLRLYRRRT